MGTKRRPATRLVAFHVSLRKARLQRVRCCCLLRAPQRANRIETLSLRCPPRLQGFLYRGFDEVRESLT